MSEAAFRSRIGTLATGAGALAAIGAALRLRRDGVAAPADVQRRLDEVLAALDMPPLDSLDAGEAARLSEVVSSVLRHALELHDNPARPAGWNHTDPALLEAQGASSHGGPPHPASRRDPARPGGAARPPRRLSRRRHRRRLAGDRSRPGLAGAQRGRHRHLGAVARPRSPGHRRLRAGGADRAQGAGRGAAPRGAGARLHSPLGPPWRRDQRAADVVPPLTAAGFEAVEIAPAGPLTFVLGCGRDEDL